MGSTASNDECGRKEECQGETKNEMGARLVGDEERLEFQIDKSM